MPERRTNLPAPQAVGLAVDDGGNAEQTPVVFLHSLGGNTRQWSHQLEFFRETRRAVAIDLPGHGGSAAPDSFQIDRMAEAVAATLTDLCVERSVLVGHSAGAGVAIACAARHREAVAGLLLLDPIGDQRLAPREEIGAFLDGLRSPRYEKVIGDYWLSILEGSDLEVRARVLQDLRSTPQATILGVLEALLDYDPVSDLATFDGPTLSVITRLNRTPISLHNLVDDLPVRTVDGTGHWLQLDRPELVNGIIAHFIEAVA